MNVKLTKIEGLLTVNPEVFEDQRGYFYESYNEEKFIKSGITNKFVQDNQSRSTYGVIRGLHMQNAPHAQAKLIRVLEGTIYDVVVDLRKESSTFGKWYGIEISADNRLQLLVPQGCCHGFSVLSEHATVFYKCDEFHHPESETGIRYDDPQLGIDWKIQPGKVSVSEKDAQLPHLHDLKTI